MNQICQANSYSSKFTTLPSPLSPPPSGVRSNTSLEILCIIQVWSQTPTQFQQLHKIPLLNFMKFRLPALQNICPVLVLTHQAFLLLTNNSHKQGRQIVLKKQNQTHLVRTFCQLPNKSECSSASEVSPHQSSHSLLRHFEPCTVVTECTTEVLVSSPKQTHPEALKCYLAPSK